MTLFSPASLLAQAAPDAAAPAPGGLLGNPMVFMGLMFVMMYFLIIRPQRKRQQEAEALQKGAKSGDQVVMVSGAHGTIVGVEDTTVTVRIADGVKVKFDKSAIARTLKKAEAAATPAA